MDKYSSNINRATQQKQKSITGEIKAVEDSVSVEHSLNLPLVFILTFSALFC
jgi:hypothetical protein